MISFTVPAVPVPTPEASRLKLPDGQVISTKAKKGSKVANFRQMVAFCFQQTYQGPPLEGPVELSLTYVLPRPGRLIWKRRPMPRVPHKSKPDLTNITKGVEDCLTKLAWKNDGQIARHKVEKWYASGDEQPHVEIEIREITA